MDQPAVAGHECQPVTLDIEHPMPLHHALWQVGDPPTALPSTRLASEQLLEDMIVRDPRLLSGDWMLIGRQEITAHGGRIDLLAIAPDGSLVLIELKRDKRFGAALDEEALNHAHQIVIVAAELDASTERIVAYLNDRDLAINVLFFQVFEHAGQQLISRVWLIDPSETQALAVTTTSAGQGDKEPWNGEFYVSFGTGPGRSWDDARRYGYISAGGGAWYTRTLKLLSPGDRVWVNIPRTGYVGVGIVQESVQPASTFKVITDQGERLAFDVLTHGDTYRAQAADEEKAEQFVRVKWLSAVPASQAFNEVGLFGNQNTVCQPTTPKWRHTVDRLKTAFKLD